MQALRYSEYPRLKSLHVLRMRSKRSIRLVLIADRLWLLRRLRRYAAHLKIHLDTIRSLEDLESMAGLSRYDMILILEGQNSKDDLYTMQCLELFWGELPVLLITAHNFHIQPIDLPHNVRAVISQDLGWAEIFTLAVRFSQKNLVEPSLRAWEPILLPQTKEVSYEEFKE